MRVVLDTNVVVSAAFFGGIPLRVINAWVDGPLLTALLVHGIFVANSEGAEVVTADPDDDKFMRCAFAANATVVSGDRHLLDVHGWHGVSVATPAQLLAQLSD